MEEEKGKLELIASKTFAANRDLIYLVDFLNKNLKDQHIMLGLTKNKDKDEMTISLYEF